MASVHDPNDTSGRLIAADQVEVPASIIPRAKALAASRTC